MQTGGDYLSPPHFSFFKSVKFYNINRLLNKNTSTFNRGAALTLNLKKLWKNELVQTAVVIGLIALAVFGFWIGSQVVLNTPYPALAVVSGSMCIPYNGACDGWTSMNHPFARTLHKGDLIIVQGVDPRELNTSYPDSDIIVFHQPSDPDDLIVHRIVAVDEVNGTLYFQTKGDGNSPTKWPDTPSPSEYDPWVEKIPGEEKEIRGVSENHVIGKVVMRIPWVGHLVLFMRNSVGLPIVAALIIIIVILEFVFPLLRKKPAEQQKEAQQQP
jgi:signal peptidase I